MSIKRLGQIFRNGLERREQVIRAIRFSKKQVGSCAQRLIQVLGVHREDNYPHPWPFRLNEPRRFNPVQAGHPGVHENHLGVPLFHPADGLETPCGLVYILHLKKSRNNCPQTLPCS